GLAQTFEVFATTYGVATAFDMASTRRGRWFDPELVDALFAFQGDSAFWQDLHAGSVANRIAAFEPPDSVRISDEEYLDLVADAFALVIDAKSPWTYRHSTGVARLTEELARTMGYGPLAIRELRRAALLHDLGKLGVSNLILDKPDKLTDAEMTIVRRHPEHTAQILQRVGCFRHLADIAASHHERLDGTGYHRRLAPAALGVPPRMLCTAAICDA